MTKKEFLNIQRKVNTVRLEINEKLEELQDYINRVQEAEKRQEDIEIDKDSPPF